MAREDYKAQVALLVRLLPYVAEEEIFALKGGTAINLLKWSPNFGPGAKL